MLPRSVQPPDSVSRRASGGAQVQGDEGATLAPLSEAEFTTAREVKPAPAHFRRSLLGTATAAATSVLGGTAVVATRVAVQSVDPLLLACLRYLIGGACLLPFVLQAPRFKIAPRDRLPVWLLGALFFGAFPLGFSVALQTTTAARGALTLSTVPLLTLLLSGLMGKERLTLAKLLGVMMAFGGVALALGNDLSSVGQGGLGVGDLLMSGAAVCGAVYNVFSQRYLRAYPPLPIMAWSMLGGSGILLGLATVTGTLSKASHIGFHGWLVVCFLGTFGTGMAFGFLAVALAAIAATRVAIFVSLNPLVAIGLSVALLREPIDGQFALGLGCLLAGIAVVNWGEKLPWRRTSQPPQS